TSRSSCAVIPARFVGWVEQREAHRIKRSSRAVLSTVELSPRAYLRPPFGGSDFFPQSSRSRPTSNQQRWTPFLPPTFLFFATFCLSPFHPFHELSPTRRVSLSESQWSRISSHHASCATIRTRPIIAARRVRSSRRIRRASPIVTDSKR